jgi:hypothetical protein
MRQQLPTVKDFVALAKQLLLYESAVLNKALAKQHHISGYLLDVLAVRAKQLQLQNLVKVTRRSDRGALLHLLSFITNPKTLKHVHHPQTWPNPERVKQLYGAGKGGAPRLFGELVSAKAIAGRKWLQPPYVLDPAYPLNNLCEGVTEAGWHLLRLALTALLRSRPDIV